MRVVSPNETSRNFNARIPPIKLIRDDEKEYAKGSYVTMKLRSVPNEEHSPTHEIQVPYFKGGTCEQFLEFIDKTQAVIVGQNITTGPQKVAFMRTVLKGDALAHFAQFFVTAGNEENITYEESIRSLTTHVFPQFALRTQTQFMSQAMRKPRDMKMRAYRNRMIEINNYLTRFPPAFDASQKKTEGELVDILHAGTPRKWQGDMVHLGFDSITATSQNLLEFCERMEFMEEIIGEKYEVNPKTGPNGGVGRSYAQPKSSDGGAYNNNFKRRKTNNKKQHARNGYKYPPDKGYHNNQQPRAGFDPNKYCELHNKVGHDLAGCNEMKQQAAKMRAQWQLVNRNGGGQNDCPYQYKKPEERNLHAMVQQMVSDSFKKQERKNKVGSFHLSSEVARMPIKQEQEDSDDNIEYGPKDHDLIAFNEMQLNAAKKDDSSDDEGIYA